MSDDAPAWTTERLRFDGVWRPEPWLGKWLAVRYEIDHGQGERPKGTRTMDGAAYGDEEAAHARCDTLNATREAVSRGEGGAGRLI